MSGSQQKDYMYVVSVTIFVKPEFVQPFIEATYLNAVSTRKEPSNVRFDVSQAVDDPTRFLLYEVYTSKDGLTFHQQQPHYLTWRETVMDWMAKPREGVKHNALFFDDDKAI
jgi:(4S)-4-hydroxy-5-phosphonooxypentane-2,3-dione isomerase